jgi:hydroxymethylglutaryl-CoA reductase
MHKPIKGFSKLSKEGKIEWIANELFDDPEKAWETLRSYWHTDARTQKLHDELIENTITNYFLPFGVAPNFKINGKMFAIPMAIEESSVVAAAAKSAQFWMTRGGFKSTVISTTKIGHVHFIYQGDEAKLYRLIDEIKPQFSEDTHEITANMRARGGGILSVNLVNKTDELSGYYQLEVRFETCDSTRYFHESLYVRS